MEPQRLLTNGRGLPIDFATSSGHTRFFGEGPSRPAGGGVHRHPFPHRATTCASKYGDRLPELVVRAECGLREVAAPSVYAIARRPTERTSGSRAD